MLSYANEASDLYDVEFIGLVGKVWTVHVLNYGFG